jgi:hypothetical protein
VIIRCVAQFEAMSGLAADRVQNVWHVRDDGVDNERLDNIAQHIRDFYVDPAEPNLALQTYFPGQIANAGHSIRCYTYDVATGERLAYEGAPPEHVEPFTFANRTISTLLGSALPTEVAVCLTMRNVTEANVPLARRSGRIYFGPVGESALDRTTNQPRVAAALSTALMAAGNELVGRLDLTLPGPNEGLVVYSRPYAGRGANEEFRANGTALPALPARAGATYKVDQFSVDNAPDTQRRRGERATVRNVLAV